MKTPEGWRNTGERNAGKIFSRLPLETQVNLFYWLEQVSDFISQLKPEDTLRRLTAVTVLAFHTNTSFQPNHIENQSQFPPAIIQPSSDKQPFIPLSDTQPFIPLKDTSNSPESSDDTPDSPESPQQQEQISTTIEQSLEYYLQGLWGNLSDEEKQRLSNDKLKTNWVLVGENIIPHPFFVYEGKERRKLGMGILTNDKDQIDGIFTFTLPNITDPNQDPEAHLGFAYYNPETNALEFTNGQGEVIAQIPDYLNENGEPNLRAPLQTPKGNNITTFPPSRSTVTATAKIEFKEGREIPEISVNKIQKTNPNLGGSNPVLAHFGEVGLPTEFAESPSSLSPEIIFQLQSQLSPEELSQVRIKKLEDVSVAVIDKTIQKIEAKVTANSLNVREGPGTDNDIINRVTIGQTLTVLGEAKISENETWYEIQLPDGQTGWVSGKYVIPDKQTFHERKEVAYYYKGEWFTEKEFMERLAKESLIYVDGLIIKDPQTNPELLDPTRSDAPITQFVNAMRMGGIKVDPQEVASNLQREKFTGADGKQYVILTFNLDPDPNQQGETLEGPIPLLIWSEEEGWRNYDINTGFVLAGKELFIPAESGWGNRELRQGVEQGWQYFPNRAITNTGEETTYHPSDPFQLNTEKLVFASKFIRTTPGRIIAGHLVWGYNGIPGRPNILPDYLVKASNEEKLTIALRHVEMVMSYFYSQFPNRNFDWVVCAEATSGNIFKPLGLHLENPDNSYVILSYRQANEVLSQFGRTRGDRGDRLAYSDFITSLNDPHISEFISILQALKSEGLIDLFHLQIRYGPNLDPNNPLTASQLSTLIDRIANEAGVPTIITELGFKDGPQSAVTKGFAEATKACFMTQNCKGIMFNKVLPENERENELFSFVNRNALPDQDYYAVLQSTLTSH